MRAWPSDATVAHLIFVDHQTLPSPDDLAEAVDHASRKGARAIRTSAMFPDAASLVVGWGFAPLDRLALLSRHLGGLASTDRVPDRDESATPTRTMRTWHFGACAEIDRDAFGYMWGNSTASLRDIREATPWHRARICRAGRRISGFALSGAAADTGYLQRLAVSPDHRRRGLARTLVVDSLDWMYQRGLRTAMVNTGVDNSAALGLYDSLGFTTLPGELTIAELRLT
jgi:ribosomal protein S18 acetylase RimI-like enzyme